MLLNSGCIFLTDDKIAGIPLLREAYLATIMLSSVFLIVFWKHVQHSKTTAWILLFGVVLPVFSAILANLNWGQPILYGLLEERRNFAYLIFFPAYFLLVRFEPTQEQIQRYMLISGLGCVFVGYLYFFKIIPQNTNIFFEVDRKDGGTNLLRPDRYRIGAGYVNLCALMLMYSIKRHLTLFKVIALGIFVSYLWMVLQTRNIMVIWALSGLWVFRNRPGLLLQMTGFAAFAAVAAYVAIPDAVSSQYDKFLALIGEATQGLGVRDTTIALSLTEVAKNNFLGLGALSLQWEDGFSRIYNEWFYLADVGIFGVYYRFGMFAPVIALIFYLGFIRIMSNCRVKGDLLSAYQLEFFLSMFNLVLSNSIMFGGENLGFAAALFLYASKSSTATEPQINKYAFYDPIPYRHY